jgi:hypothetical protein
MPGTTTVILCVSGHHRLRVPVDRGRLKVTCPVCRASWDWAPPRELRELRFRCAQTSGRFYVTFGRQDPFHRFRVLNVAAEPPPSGLPLLSRQTEAGNETHSVHLLQPVSRASEGRAKGPRERQLKASPSTRQISTWRGGIVPAVNTPESPKR